MIQTVTLVLADDISDAFKLMKSEGLKADNVACITDAAYLDHLKLKPDEQVFISANASNELTSALYNAISRDLGAGQKLNIACIMPDC